MRVAISSVYASSNPFQPVVPVASSDSEKPTSTVLSMPEGRAGARPDALSDLYLLYRRDVVEFVRRKFGAGPPEPDDVAQAVFLQLAAQSQLDAIQNPRSFLLKSAQNVVLGYHRKHARRKHQPNDLERVAQKLASDIDPEQVATGEQRLGMLLNFIVQLPADKRQMIVLSRFHGMSCEAIGQLQGVSAEAVQKQIERILKDCLAKLRIREDIDTGEPGSARWKGKAQDRA